MPAGLTREGALTLHATLWEGGQMAAFCEDERITDWLPYRLGAAEAVRVSGFWSVTHLAVRNGAGPDAVLLRFPLRGGKRLRVVPGDSLDLPPAPWLTSLF